MSKLYEIPVQDAPDTSEAYKQLREDFESLCSATEKKQHKIHNLKADMNMLVKQCEKVRNCQIHYYKTRKPDALYESKKEEAQLSYMCAELRKKYSLIDYD